ncbi:MAG: C10 family peptidase [Bacteroidia bacterium]|nr:C10 family peptidase [Bacteroidia bacterium]
MQKLILVALVIIFSVNFSSGKPVNFSKANSVAKNFWFEKSYSVTKIGYDQVMPERVYSKTELNDTLYNVFNIGNDGFIIVSGDDACIPVLAYSYEGGFNSVNISPSLMSMLWHYANEIRYIRNNRLEATDDIAASWAKYSSVSFHLLKNYDTPSVPLILTKWDQGFPYNEYCPVDAAGPGGHAVVGCVAVAFAQIMKFYNYPAYGTGNHSYMTQSYGDLYANFNSVIHWTNMPYSITQSNYDVSSLLYNVGVMAEMDYSATGSGADIGTAVQGLKNYFKYSNSIQYVKRHNYNDTQWKSLITTEIDAGRPVIYEGFDSTGGGHAWNCDAYQNGYFHMNWGWGGNSNGFFNLNSLSAGGYLFNNSEGLVTGIYPLGNYPGYCSATEYITGNEGTFDDGSGAGKYENNINCMWKITPQCGSKIQLSFDLFNVASGDTLYVYDGLTIYNNVLAHFTEGDSLYVIISTSNNLLVRFVTNGSNVADGWSASYKSIFCAGTEVHTEVSGTLNDGSGTCDYKPSTNCKWSIEPPGATSITLNFTAFDLYNDIDNVLIYKNEFADTNLVANLNANTPPTGPITVNAPKVILKFFTTSMNNAGGWSASYSSVINPQGIAEQENIKFAMYPNPAGDKVMIEFHAKDVIKGSISISDITGRIVVEVPVSGGNGKLSTSIQTADYPDGLYFVKVSAGTYSDCRKLIIQH